MVNFYNNQFSKFSFLLFSLILLSSQLAFSQGDNIELRQHVIRICSYGGGGTFDINPILNSKCGPGSLHGKVSENSSDLIELSIVAYAVNIPNATDGINNSFPEGYPRPFLRYEYSPGVYKYTDELTNWTLIDKFESLDGKVDYFYKAEKLVQVKLPKSAECNNENSTMNFSMDLKLSTFSAKSDAWEDYPIHQFGGSDDIFSCEIFDDTKHICDSSLEPAEVDSSVDICVPCQNTTFSDLIFNSVELDKNTQLKILSNPFTDILEYQLFSQKESEFDVSLHSFDGQNVVNTHIKTSIGQNDFQISGDHLKSGIYYLSFVGEGTKTVRKVMCVR